MAKRIVFSTNGVLTTRYPAEEWSWTSTLHPYTKINSKCFIDLNIGTESQTLLEGNRSKFLWTWIRQWFCRYDSKSTWEKKKRAKPNLKRFLKRFIKVKKKLCVLKDIIMKVKLKSTLSDRGLASRMYKELFKFNNKK